MVLEAGCHLLIEKPIAQTIEEAETLIDLADRKGLCLSVGHIERFNPVIARLHEIIRSKDCGELKSLVSKRVGPYPKQIKDMNVVIDLAVHDIDLFAFLLDRQPLHVSGHSGFANLDSHQDYASIFLDYGDLSGFIQASWISPIRQRSLELQFTEAYLEVDYVAQQIVKYTQDAQGDPHKEVIQISPLEPLKAELTHVLHCLDHPSESIISGKVGLEALKVALMV